MMTLPCAKEPCGVFELVEGICSETVLRMIEWCPYNEDKAISGDNPVYWKEN